MCVLRRVLVFVDQALRILMRCTIETETQTQFAGIRRMETYRAQGDHAPHYPYSPVPHCRTYPRSPSTTTPSPTHRRHLPLHRSPDFVSSVGTLLRAVCPPTLYRTHSQRPWKCYSCAFVAAASSQRSQVDLSCLLSCPLLLLRQAGRQHLPAPRAIPAPPRLRPRNQAQHPDRSSYRSWRCRRPSSPARRALR